MITARIDLASQPLNTAPCVIDWSTSPAQSTRLATNADAGAIASVAHSVDKFGADVPLGLGAPVSRERERLERVTK